MAAQHSTSSAAGWLCSWIVAPAQALQPLLVAKPLLSANQGSQSVSGRMHDIFVTEIKPKVGWRHDSDRTWSLTAPIMANQDVQRSSLCLHLLIPSEA
jgi:hypothetical protein